MLVECFGRGKAPDINDKTGVYAYYLNAIHEYYRIFEDTLNLRGESIKHDFAFEWYWKLVTLKRGLKIRQGSLIQDESLPIAERTRIENELIKKIGDEWMERKSGDMEANLYYDVKDIFPGVNPLSQEEIDRLGSKAYQIRKRKEMIPAVKSLFFERVNDFTGTWNTTGTIDINSVLGTLLITGRILCGGMVI